MSQVKKKLPTPTGGENETASLKPPHCTYIHKYHYIHILIHIHIRLWFFELEAIPHSHICKPPSTLQISMHKCPDRCRQEAMRCPIGGMENVGILSWGGWCRSFQLVGIKNYQEGPRKKTSTQEWPNKIMSLSNKWMNKKNNTQHMSLVATSHLKPQHFSNVLSGTSTQSHFLSTNHRHMSGKKYCIQETSHPCPMSLHMVFVCLKLFRNGPRLRFRPGPVRSMEQSTYGEAVYLVSWT